MATLFFRRVRQWRQGGFGLFVPAKRTAQLVWFLFLNKSQDEGFLEKREMSRGAPDVLIRLGAIFRASFAAWLSCDQMARQFGFAISPPADILVKDGDHIEVGDISLEVIHTPGHSPGGICLYGHLMSHGGIKHFFIQLMHNDLGAC